jgi:hypothetical protein
VFCSFSIGVAAAAAAPPELLLQLTEDQLLSLEGVAVLDQRLDLVLLLRRERHAGPRQRGDALDRIVEGLAQLDRRPAGVSAQHGRHVEGQTGRPVEDVVALTGHVLDVGERQQQVLDPGHGLAARARHAGDRFRQVGDIAGRHVRRATGRLDDPLGFPRHLLGLDGRVVGALQGDAHPHHGADGRHTDDLRRPAERAAEA